MLACLLPALAGCADMSMDALKQRAGLAAPVAKPVPPPDPKTQMPALETRIAVLVEEQRIKADPKAKRLAIDDELSKVARERAKDMAEKNYLAHAAPNGDTSATLLMAENEQFQGLLGENLAAQHYVTQSGVDPEAFAKRFLDTWMGSPAHRDNLTFADYDRTGVGAAVNGDTVYVAQLFATEPPPGSAAPPGGVASFANPSAAKAASAPAAPLRLRGTIGGTDGR